MTFYFFWSILILQLFYSLCYGRSPSPVLDVNLAGIVKPRCVLPLSCTLWVLLEAIFQPDPPSLSSTVLPHPQNIVFQAAEDARAAFNSLVDSVSLSLSLHGIQIISRASLCCCTEGMGVFELDPADNILSTQISIHATLFHVDRAALGGLLTGLLIFWEKFKRESRKRHNSLLSSCLFGSFDTIRSDAQPLRLNLHSRPSAFETFDRRRWKTENTLGLLWLDRLALSAATPAKLTNSK